MESIATLESLKSLEVVGNRSLTDRGICALGRLPRLERLGVNEITNFTGKGFNASGFTSLTSLSAADSVVVDETLADLKLPSLTSLLLLRTKITEPAVRAVFPVDGSASVDFGSYFGEF